MLQLHHGGTVHAPGDVSKDIFVPSVDGLDRGRIRIRGNTVEWSLANGHVVDRTYRFPQSVLDVALVEFNDTPGHSVCILARSDRMTVIPPTGSVVEVPLPFQAASIFAMQKGLLIERSKIVSSTKMPVLFSLLHPLEEIKPVVVQVDSTQRLEDCVFVSDPLETLVFVQREPQFVVFYHPHHQTFRIKTIVTHFQNAKSSSIIPEIVLHQIWESPSVPSTDLCKLFVTSDIDSSPMLCILNPASHQLLVQRMVVAADSSVLSVDPSIPSHILPARLAAPVARDSAQAFDLVVLTPQNQWALYRGTHVVATLLTDTTPVHPANVQGIVSTPYPHTLEVHLMATEIHRLVLPTTFASPLLQTAFALLDQVLPPPFVLAWRIGILPTEWRGFTSSLLAAVGNNPAPPTTTTDSPYDQWLASDCFKTLQHAQPKLFGPPVMAPCTRATNDTIESSSLDPQLLQQIHHHMERIFLTLHLLYEDIKVSTCSLPWLRPLGIALGNLARAAGMASYFHHYVQDLGPERFESTEDVGMQPGGGPTLAPPVDLFAWIQQRMATFHYNSLQPTPRPVPDFPTSPALVRTQHVVALYSNLYPDFTAGTAAPPLHLRAQQVVRHLVTIPHFERMLHDLPDGVALPLRYALTLCKHEPSDEWDSAACAIIHRPDWVGQGRDGDACDSHHDGHRVATLAGMGDANDGFDDVMTWNAPLFPTDHRLKEVGRLLRSNKLMYLKIHRDPLHSDADVLNLQQSRLLLLCKRSMAMPVARGMVTLGSLTPHASTSLTTPLVIPPMPLAARIAETNARTVLDTSGYKELTLWPKFHNGVATALRLPPAHERDVTAQWILSHKPKQVDDEDDVAAHAGFILGLGLLGHLHHLSQSAIYQYLSMDHELTSVGLLLGLAATTVLKQKDLILERTVSRILSLHLPILLPPTFAHVNITPSAQTASILGLGLVYHGTGNRNMTEIMLSEITAAPIVMSPTSSQSSVDLSQKEGYALAAGMAVGLITLGRQSDTGLADLHLEEKLGKYMVGGTQKIRHDPTNCVLRTKKKSAQLESINVDVTAAGSALALAFMYIQSNHERVIEQLRIPSTMVLLETIRPDILFVRVVATNLVGWAAVQPTRAWVLETQLRPCLNEYHEDASTTQEAHANILAGACFSLGLKFAGPLSPPTTYALSLRCVLGTHDVDAKATLLYFLADFQATKAKAKELSRVTWERCLGVLVQALALVMAGSGDLESFRTLRAILLRQKNDGDVSYGNHMAASSALGLLFLGGGRLSLQTTPFAVAILVIAFFPMYPNKTSDQKYHLQALRHLYVLAIDPTRLVETIDVDTGALSPVDVTLTTKSPMTVTMRTPCLLPRFKTLSVTSARHFRVSIDMDDAVHTANVARAETLKKSRRIFVKRKQGDLASPQLTLLRQFHRWFVDETPSTGARWGAFCSRVWQECELQHKPHLLPVYLNAKHCEEAVLAQTLSHTLMVSNLQLMHLHMELEAHVFQYEEHAGHLGVAQLINEDFILGCSNNFLLHFSDLDSKSDSATPPRSIDHCAYLRHLGTPDLMHWE
ncbi:Aste57867_8134 [Aphanomyces stellatus]|uniref:Aste57867_8134 protein n=1 Tax=Aphanomyces stellatus TaxID=120398 RepID=A0A485KJG0_9STRA|nr:hypothetical protein As57867_008104 [Aphanomyces stellatus]VFT85023.1 Aste57867_8134 [Aphanomyces stellatus]